MSWYLYIVAKKTYWAVAKHQDDCIYYWRGLICCSIVLEFVQSMCWSLATTQDPSSLIRRSFIDKTFKLLKEHIIPIRYACAFALAASCSDKDMQKDVSSTHYTFYLFRWAQAFSISIFTMFSHNACFSHWDTWQNL